jgi:hypothetical protein
MSEETTPPEGDDGSEVRRERLLLAGTLALGIIAPVLVWRIGRMNPASSAGSETPAATRSGERASRPAGRGRTGTRVASPRAGGNRRASDATSATQRPARRAVTPEPAKKDRDPARKPARSRDTPATPEPVKKKRDTDGKTRRDRGTPATPEPAKKKRNPARKSVRSRGTPAPKP